MEIAELPRQSFFIRRAIPLSLPNQRVRDVAWLPDHTCVILLESKVVIVNLNPESGFEQKVFPIENSYRNRIIVPLGDATFCVYVLQQSSIDIQFKDQQLVQSKVNITEDNFYFIGPLFFHKTGKVQMVTEHSGQTRIKSIGHPQAPIVFTGRTSGQWFYGCLDEQNLVLKSISEINNTIKIYNISNKQQFDMSLPESISVKDIFQRDLNFFVINSNILLTGALKSKVFQLSIYNITEKTCKVLFSRGSVSSSYFNSADRNQSIICLTLCQGDFKEKEATLVWVNYLEGLVAWEHIVKGYSFRVNQVIGTFQNPFQLTKRISPNLQNYVEIDSSRQELHHYYRPSIKKRLFHLYSKSRLQSQYGQALIRRVLTLSID